MKKIFFFILVINMVNLGLAQVKTSTTSSTQYSESYSYSSTFDEKQEEQILNYLKQEIGENYNVSEQNLVWSSIRDVETKNDEISIILKTGIIEINYNNKNNFINPLILERLKKISDFIVSIKK